MDSTAVTTQPTRSQTVLVGLEGHRDWSTGLCGCLTDRKSCICTYCCLPVMMCRVSIRLNECPLMPCLMPCTMATIRTKVRTMGGIEGSICGDCVATCCCFMCTVCQLSREMDFMGLQ